MREKSYEWILEIVRYYCCTSVNGLSDERTDGGKRNVMCNNKVTVGLNSSHVSTVYDPLCNSAELDPLTETRFPSIYFTRT